MEIKDVEKLAELAKIELTEEEKVKIIKDMEGILDYVKQIQEVEVEDVDVEYEHKNIWREDMEEDRDFSLDIITSQFPSSKDGFVKVKKII